MLKSIVNNQANLDQILDNILKKIHEHGPIFPEDFEILACIKKFYPDIFRKYENKLTYLIGLFYKTNAPESLIETVYSLFSQKIFDQTNRHLTPVQASIYDKILTKKYFSFSAPTSTGKSFILRELIHEFDGDIVIIVPSRALIAEYMLVILEKLGLDKSILVLQFAENVNIAHTSRRIYILTPERGADLFKIKEQLNIKLFLFDEAQISEEEIRGMTFDAFIRRAEKEFSEAQKVFTHPFVDNPEAQLQKHDLINDFSASSKYCQHSVGKLFLTVKSSEFKYFSPYIETQNYTSYKVEGDDLIYELLEKNKTLLVYISKSKIYQRKHISEFKGYIDACLTIEDVNALKIIAQLREFIGASKDLEEKHSIMIELMEKGIVIHHGSIPLKGRLLIERFVNAGYAKICFATSTLIQGINMPFDIVWIDSFQFRGSDEQKILDMKNLIGRAGRSSNQKGSFDYGYVIVMEKNRKTFSDRLKLETKLSPESSLDKDLSEIPEDLKDLAEAIKEDTFDSDLNLTESQIERIKDKNVSEEIQLILDNLISGTSIVTEAEYRKIKPALRDRIKKAFQKIYLSHLRKQLLSDREKRILSVSISILLWRVQGKSFREIISLRYAYLAQKDKQREIAARLKSNEITSEEALNQKRALKIKYSQAANTLPTSEAGRNPLFHTELSVLDLDYDQLVYDTYDYLDKVISLCLVDPINGALKIYYDSTNDQRAIVLSNFIRYGTNDHKEIWLLRYGFEPEDIEWVKNHIVSIDENEIVFDEDIDSLPEEKYNVISRYIP